MSDGIAFIPPERDLRLASGVTRHVEDHYGYENIMRWDIEIPLECRVPEFTLAACGIGECSGYVAFLMMDCRHCELPNCFRILGLPDLALLIDKMLARIPAEGVLGHEEALEHHFGSWDDFAEWVGQFENELFRNFVRIVSAIASYCRVHASSFTHLSPEIAILFAEDDRDS